MRIKQGVFGIFVFLIAGCNDSQEAYNEILPIVETRCSPCHNGRDLPSFNSTNFKTSTVQATIRDGSMPPAPAVLSANEKRDLLAYFMR